MPIRDAGLTDADVAEVRFRYEDRVGGERAFSKQLSKFESYWTLIVKKRPDNPVAALTAWMRREADSASSRPGRGGGGGSREPKVDPTLESRFLKLWERTAEPLTAEILAETERPEGVPTETWHEHAHHEARLWALQKIADRDVDAAADEARRAGEMIRPVAGALNRRRDDFARDYGCPPGCVEFILARETSRPRRDPEPISEAIEDALEW